MDRFFQFILFFTILISLFGFMQWYIIRSYVRWLDQVVNERSFYQFRTGGIAGFIIFNILFFLRFPSTDLGWYQHPLFQFLVIYPGGIFLGAVILTFMLLLFINTGATFFRALHRSYAFLKQKKRHSLVSRKPEGNGMARPITDSDNAGTRITPLLKKPAFINKRRQFLKTTGAAMFTAPVAFTVGAAAVTSHDYRIIKKRLEFPDLPAGLDGFRLVQISDLHSGIYMTEQQIRDIFHLANEQHPDLITITGDFVDNSTAEIPAVYNALPDLKSEYGVFGCLGNHDHYASASAVTSALKQRNVSVLTNEHQTLYINGEQFTLIGVDDAMGGGGDAARLNRAVKKAPGDDFRVLLTHRPDLFDEAIHRDIDLSLAGHTHGGQIGLDLLGKAFYPIDLFQKYPRGLYKHNAHKLYVNVGIGMVGVPVRTLRPELTVIELGRPA